MMRQYKDLPLDDDEENLLASSAISVLADHLTDSDAESDGESKKQSAAAGEPSSSQRKKISFEDRFACNRGGTLASVTDNPNAKTIETLQKMCDYYDRVRDQWRSVAYRKAISVLKRQPVKITTEEEAYKLPSIGRRLAAKIEEIANTNRLQRLEHAQSDPADEILRTFTGIYGVGTNQARRWIAQGHRTLEDLLEKAKLTPNQRLGIEHYEDLNTQIPRREVEALGCHVKSAAASIDPDVQVIIGGSYRRGAPTSSDIDLIVTKRNTVSSSELFPFLGKLVDVLTQDQFIVATLVESLGSKWHGCCVLPPTSAINDSDERRPTIWRRIDILLVPETQLGAALIYFTGNDIFNRSIRLLASKKGMRLNQRGLYRNVLRGPGRTGVTEDELVEGRDERRIFEILGVKWRDPWERWC